MTARPTFDDMGKSHGKYDMERIGLFSEMPYMIGDKYPNKKDNIRDLKKSQMYPSTLKTKTGLQDAYFEPQFKRLYENEKWKPPPTGLFDKNENKKKQVSTHPFIPTGPAKHHSTAGDHFGTFGPKLSAMSNVKKPSPKKEKLQPYIFTKPTNTRGPGYTDIGFSPFPEYKSSPYNDVKKHNIKDRLNKTSPFLTGGSYEFFEKNPYFSNDQKSTYNTITKPKFKGTPFVPPSTINHIGNGFEKWPSHSDDRYIDPFRIGYKNKKDKKDDKSIITFYPQTRNKSLYTTSTIQRKLKIAMNNHNWRTFDTITYPAETIVKQ
ncbi:cilia-and flagella-associated protein 96-like [Metopolophium dirhodum]|uniref:cilia-and flagella-associated protein 96-like n=1 Tax=Metopolophium dirhodum TaxID=44670 RepID=UPI0029903FDE|nr:cilia-and flagella-associated protein 96-like [Metopolophium dirhodum]